MVLESAGESSPALFAEGMDQVLSAYAYMYGDEICALIDPHAIGLYEKCRMYSPQLVSAFDTNHKLPWDDAYYSWLQSCDNIAVYFDCEAVPVDVRPLMLELQPLPWGATVRANW